MAPASGTSYGTADVSDRNVASPLCRPTPECALTDPTAEGGEALVCGPLTPRLAFIHAPDRPCCRILPLHVANYVIDPTPCWCSFWRAAFGVLPFLCSPWNQVAALGAPRAVPRHAEPEGDPMWCSARGESSGLAGMSRDTPSTRLD